jgi:hypothetical protein
MRSLDAESRRDLDGSVKHLETHSIPRTLPVAGEAGPSIRTLGAAANFAGTGRGLCTPMLVLYVQMIMCAGEKCARERCVL